MKEDEVGVERQEVFQHLTALLQRECPSATEGLAITWETTFQTDLVVTSIELVRLMAGLQHEFRVSLEDQDISRLETMRDVVELVLALRRAEVARNARMSGGAGRLSWKRLVPSLSRG